MTPHHDKTCPLRDGFDTVEHQDGKTTEAQCTCQKPESPNIGSSDELDDRARREHERNIEQLEKERNEPWQ